MEKIGEKKILAYALKNAIEHEGKAREAAVLSPLFHEGLDKSKVKKVMPIIKKIVKEVNSMTVAEQEREFLKLQDETSHREGREGLPELPKVLKTGIITRFAPSPSGPMHIGHVATGMPSSLYVKKYGGKFYIRIEDTNPENICSEAYDMISDEADWIFGNVTDIIIQSERMDRYYEFIVQLIKKNVAYICDCDPEKFKELLKKRKACPCRELSVGKQLERWKKMLDKKGKGYKEGQAVVLFKSGLKYENPALRDFPLARINDSSHPRKGKKYRVWPLMNLSVSVDDMDYKMTHIIRAKEHRDNAVRQAMIFKVFNKKIPETFFLGRYKFTDLEISCSKIKQLIKKKKYSGWDDIRLPFLAALRKRGYQPAAFVKMAEQRGLSEVDKVIKKEDYFAVLDLLNREVLKDTAKKIKLFNKKASSLREITILMPNASRKKMFIDSKELKGIKEKEIVYFDDFGYCKLNKNVFWFAHR